MSLDQAHPSVASVLPFDILSLIFEASLSTIGFSLDYPYYPVSKPLYVLRLRLRNVCKHWRVAVDSCYALQNRRVFFAEKTGAGGAWESDLNADGGGSTLRQLREVVLVGPVPRITHVLAQFSTVDSITSSLNIEATSDDQTPFSFPSNIPTISLPHLTSLHLERVAFDWNTRHHSFPRLTHLSLCDITNRPHILQLMDALTFMPALLGLILRSALPTLHDSVPPHASLDFLQQVDLPRLRYLRLQGSVAECFKTLTRIPSLNRLRHLGLECFQGTLTPGLAFRRLRDLIHGHFQGLAGDYSTLAVTCTDQVTVGLSTWNHDAPIWAPVGKQWDAGPILDFWYISPSPPAVVFREMARSTLLHNVRRFRASGFQNRTVDLREILSDMSALHSLAVSDMSAEALSMVLLPDELEVPAPNLKELSLPHGSICSSTRTSLSLLWGCLSARSAREYRIERLALCGECNMVESIGDTLSALGLNIIV